MTTIQQIKQAVPDIESEKVEILAEEIDRIEALKTLFRSDSGKVLLNRLTDNCTAALTHLYSAIKEEPSLEQLMGIIATYKANIDLLAELQDIGAEEEIQRQLEEAVKEYTATLG